MADAGQDGDKARLDKTNPSETSLMEVLGVRNQSGEDGAQVDVAQADTPSDRSDTSDTSEASSPALAFNDPTPDRPAEAATTEETVKEAADKDNKAAVTSKVVTPPILDVAQTRRSDDADLAVRQLKDATAAILKLNNSKRLIDFSDPSAARTSSRRSTGFREP